MTATTEEQYHGRPWWRWIIWIIAGILLLPVMAVLLLQLAPVQDYLRRQGEQYLERKLHTKVRIGYLRARGWQYLELRHISVTDTASQALLYSGSLKVRYNLLSLINNELRINKLEWDTLLANVYRHPQDSTFNYQFVIDAFVSKNNEPDTLVAETGTTLQFHIKDLDLRQVRVRYVDGKTGMTAVVRWDSLHVDPDDLLINEGLYAFRGLALSGLKGYLRQEFIPPASSRTEPPPPPADTNSTPFHLLLKKLRISNSSFLYADAGSGISTAWKIGQIQLDNSNIDLDSTRVQIGELKLDKTSGIFSLNTGKDTSTAVPTDSTPNTWQVLAAKVSLNDLAFAFDNNTSNSPRAKHNDPDYNHLLLSRFSANISDLRYKADSTSAQLKQLTLKDRSGFAVKSFRTNLLYTPQTVSLQQLWLETNQSLLKKNIAITVPSWSTIADNLDLLQLNANLDSSRIALGEWLPFVPDARKNKNFAPLWNKKLAINAILKGSLGQLIIQELYIKDNEGNLIQAKGEVAHVTNMDLMQANIPTLLVQTGNRAIRSWLPHGTLPDTPRLPEHMLITGSFIGGMQDMKTELQLKSDIATANLSAHLQNITDSIRANYNVNLPFFRIHPGVMLYDTAIGWVSGRLAASGRGYDLKSMAANVAAQLNEATYKGYTYHDIDVKGNIDHRRFQVNGNSADTAITANFDIAGVIADTTLRELAAHLQVEKADLYSTHWYAEPLVLKANLDADFPSIEPRNIQGQALLTSLQIATKGQVFPLDTVALEAKRDSVQQHLSLKGPFGFLNANGDIDYTKVGDAFSKLILRPIQPPDSAKQVVIPPGQVLAWNAAISWPRSLQALLPGLRMEMPLTMEGRLNSDSSLLWVNAALPKVRYDSLQVDSLQLKAQINDSVLDANVSLARLQHPLAPLQHTSIKAHAVAGKLDWDLLLQDAKNAPKYKVGGLLSFLPANVMQLSLKPDLLLNRLQWNVEENNLVRLRDGLPDSANLKLSYKEQSIALVTQADTSRFPAVHAQIKDFQLSTITGLLAADTLLATGILNGEATARNLDKAPLIAANIQLDSLTFRGSKLGTLKADVQTPQPNQYKLAANLNGNDNNINVDGTYDSTINAKVDITNINMASLEAFTFGQVTRMQGSANGQFTIAGTTDKPLVNGKLHFNEAGGNINYIGSTLRLPDEELVIDNKGIALNQLTIADSLNNELVVNGRINTTDFRDYQFLLDVNAENFMALGEQKSPDQWIYGPAFIDTKVKIRGNLDLPRVDMSLKLRDKSKVTVSMPSSEPGLADREGVIVFVDKDNPIDSSLIANQDTARFQNPRLKGIIFSGNAEITPASTVKMIIDPQNGDFVEAKGTANINATLDPSSKMSLTGRYELQEGKYEMSLNQLIKRSFDIVKGSVITFNGDAMDADLDITAKYTANAQAMDLVADQLGNMNATDRNKYKQRLPFEVYLMIKGNLKKPDISFRLDMPERERNAFGGSVYNRLKQINQVTSELNKQVMGLLVLGTFIPDDPMAALSGGGGMEQAARQSVSKILSQQLNNLAGNLIKGVDINFDLQNRQDYSSGSAQENTNLNVGVSKRLFNDRLTVSVGSNIMLQGQSQNTSSLVGDISAEYQLTRDGRYRIRVYQRNATETIVQGQVVETGVAFMIVMDYDEFSEILRRSKRDKELKKEQQKGKKKSKKEKR